MTPRTAIAPVYGWRSTVCSPDGPSPTVRHVLLALSLYMSERGDSCFPSLESLAGDTGLAKRTVIRALADAKEQGWITKERGGGRQANGKGNPNRYTATLPPNLRCHTVTVDPNSTVTLTTKKGDPVSPDLSISFPVVQETAPAGATAPEKINLTAHFEAFEAIIKRKPLTASERGKWARGLRELAAAGITADGLEGLCRAYRKEWPAAELTPTALAANLSRFATKATPPREAEAARIRRMMAERGVL